MKITNNSDLPLPILLWAVNDSYDYVEDPKYISVTTLLKPVRQIILSRRINQNELSVDAEDYLAASMGTAIHDSIEKAWTQNHEKNLQKLGFNETYINKFKVNPKPEEVKEGDIPVYLEHRSVKEFKGWKIGGKFDFVLNGLLHDNKSTTTMKWTKGSSDNDYRIQGSLYRWLNQDIITEDYIRINFIFTDWSKANALKDPSYPQHRAMYRDIPLMSIQETEAWLMQKLSVLDKYMEADEKDIPLCPEDMLWRTPTKFKFYSNPQAQRATKVFDNQWDAYRYQQIEKNGQGIIKTFVGEARRCRYCNACSLCSQFTKEFPNGT